MKEKLRDIGHNCPVCKIKVVGYRPTKIYCAAKCKAHHHYHSKNQLKDRVEDENKLVKRNAYLLEGILGPNYSSFTMKVEGLELNKFQSKRFQKSILVDNKEMFQIANYQYYIDDKNFIHVTRIGEVSDYTPGFYERWLLKFPLVNQMQIKSSKALKQFKYKTIINQGVWRE